LAALLEVSLAEVAQNIVPVAKTEEVSKWQVLIHR